MEETINEIIIRPVDVGLRNAACDAVRLAHGSRKYAKALRRVEDILLRGLGYATFAEFVLAEREGEEVK